MATNFSSSKSGLLLDPFTSSGRTTNAASYGNAVNLGALYKANRTGFDPSSFLAQDTASNSLASSNAMKAEGNAYATSLGAEAMVSQAKKRAAEANDAAKKAASKSIWGSALGAVAGIGGTLLSGGNPLVGMAAAQGGQALGSAIG